MAFLLDAGILFVLKESFGLHYQVAGVAAFIVGLTFTYILNTTVVFTKRRVANRLVEFAIFGAIGLSGIGLNYLFLWLFTGVLEYHILVSKVISTGFIWFWNFGLKKFFLFR